MAYYDSEEIYDLEQEIVKLKQENANLRKQIKDKEARIMELDRVERETQGIQDNYLLSFCFMDYMGQQGIGSVTAYFDHKPTVNDINRFANQIMSERNFKTTCVLTMSELGVGKKEESK